MVRIASTDAEAVEYHGGRENEKPNFEEWYADELLTQENE